MYNYIVKEKNFYSILFIIMEQANSIQMSERLPQLMENINETCNALISALEVNAQSVWTYGWSVAHQINTEYVDILIKTLLKIKYHLARLDKELNNWLVSSEEDLKYIIWWLLETLDTIDTICAKDGYLRNSFSFAIDELKSMIGKMLEEIKICTVA